MAESRFQQQKWNTKLQTEQKCPFLGTNHTAGFGGFYPFASMEKNKQGIFLHNHFKNLTKNVILRGKMSILCDI